MEARLAWGRWGASDERGALNLLTEDVVLDAASEIRRGRVYSLGLPLQASGVPLYAESNGLPMRLTMMNQSDADEWAGYGAAEGTGAHVDLVSFCTHTTSHMDALCHVYEDNRHYNGFPASSMRTRSGATKLGVEKVEAIVGRAVLLDVAGVRRVPWIEAGDIIDVGDLQACERRIGFTIRPGDIALIRTGYIEHWFAEGGQLGIEQPGLCLDGARWLADRDVVAIGADNTAIEPIPQPPGHFLEVHKEMLVRRGIYLLELLDLRPLVRDGVSTGLLCVAPLKVTGATGCPVNPILIS